MYKFILSSDNNNPLTTDRSSASDSLVWKKSGNLILFHNYYIFHFLSITTPNNFPLKNISIHNKTQYISYQYYFIH